MLFADNLDKQPFSTVAVKLVIKNVLPGPKVQMAVGDCDDHLPAHHLTLQVCVGVVFGTVMSILIVWLFWGQFLQPNLIVVMQAGFVVVDKH